MRWKASALNVNAQFVTLLHSLVVPRPKLRPLARLGGAYAVPPVFAKGAIDVPSSRLLRELRYDQVNLLFRKHQVRCSCTGPKTNARFIRYLGLVLGLPQHFIFC